MLELVGGLALAVIVLGLVRTVIAQRKRNAPALTAATMKGSLPVVTPVKPKPPAF